MAEFWITLEPTGSGNDRSTDSGVYVEFWDGSVWGAKVEVPFHIWKFRSVFGIQTTAKINMPGFDTPPEWLQLTIGGGDLLVVGHVTVASAPTPGQRPSSKTVSVFDFKGTHFSTDTSEGVTSKFEQELALDAKHDAWTAWDDYLVLIETRGLHDDDGTKSAIELEFYDMDCNAIGQKLNVSGAMSQQNQVLYSNSIIPVSVTLPSPTFDRRTENPPLPVFLDVSTKGSDAWALERIWVIRRKSGAEPLDATTLTCFEFGATLSKDDDEGVATLSASAQGFEIKTIDRKSHVKKFETTYSLANGAGASTPTNKSAVEISRGFTKSISKTNEKGDKNSNSIEVGATIGYNPPSTAGGVTGSFSTKYTHSWEKWSTNSGTKLYNESKDTKSSAEFNAPIHTIRLGKWTVVREVVIETISNGFGDPVELQLVPDGGLQAPDTLVVDVNDDNHITWADWNDWKANLSDSKSVTEKDIQRAENDMKERNWLPADCT